MRIRQRWQFETMAAAECLFITEQWIRDKLNLQHKCLADVRSLRLPGTYEQGKIGHLGISLKNFVRLKSLDLSHNALVSVEGIVHLKELEKLNLYYNRISSLRDILELGRLQNLKELDLRLNPVVKKDPQYRLYLVHAVNKLRMLDDCPVRDRERKAALMHFSVETGVASSQKAPPDKEETTNSRGSGSRIASVNRLMMSKLSLRDGNEENVLNHRSEENRAAVTPRDRPGTRHPAPRRPLSDAPGVTFTGRPEHPRRGRAETSFTPHPGYRSTPISLHDPDRGRSNDRTVKTPSLKHRRPGDDVTPERRSPVPERVCKDEQSRSMEALLSLVDEYWSGKKNHDAKHFFTHAVRILCTMEREVSDSETRAGLLRHKNVRLKQLVRKQEEEHQSELQRVTEELQRAHHATEHLDEELRSVLEENVSLQKQLISLEQQLLSEKLKETPR